MSALKKPLIPQSFKLVLVVVFLLNVVWCLAIFYYLEFRNEKTVATVIAVDSLDSDENSYYATYSYLDKYGIEYIESDSDNTFNDLTKSFLGVEVGDQVTVYYGESNPTKPLFAQGFTFITIILFPLIIFVTLLVYVLLIWVLYLMLKGKTGTKLWDKATSRSPFLNRHRNVFEGIYEGRKNTLMLQTFAGGLFLSVMLLVINYEDYWPLSLLLSVIPLSVLYFRFKK